MIHNFLFFRYITGELSFAWEMRKFFLRLMSCTLSKNVLILILFKFLSFRMWHATFNFINVVLVKKFLFVSLEENKYFVTEFRCYVHDVEECMHFLLPVEFINWSIYYWICHIHLCPQQIASKFDWICHVLVFIKVPVRPFAAELIFFIISISPLITWPCQRMFLIYLFKNFWGEHVFVSGQ